LPYSETDMTIVLDKGLRRPHWRTRSRPLCNLTLPNFDYQPRRAYTHENGFAFTISRVFRPSHQLGRDADACRSQHRHCVYVRFFCSNDHEADFSAGRHCAVQPPFWIGSLVRHAAAVCVAIRDLLVPACHDLASGHEHAVSVFLRNGSGKDLGKAAFL
jgi:hypothetical protein